MSKLLVIAATLAISVGGCTMATVVEQHHVYESRTVVQPRHHVIVQHHRPICRWETVPVYGTRQYVEYPDSGSVIAGTILGGALGNQFGSGSGRDAATVAGALLGGSLASQPRMRTEEYIVGYERIHTCG